MQRQSLAPHTLPRLRYAAGASQAYLAHFRSRGLIRCEFLRRASTWAPSEAVTSISPHPCLSPCRFRARAALPSALCARGCGKPWADALAPPLQSNYRAPKHQVKDPKAEINPISGAPDLHTSTLTGSHALSTENLLTTTVCVLSGPVFGVAPSYECYPMPRVVHRRVAALIGAHERPKRRAALIFFSYNLRTGQQHRSCYRYRFQWETVGFCSYFFVAFLPVSGGGVGRF
jgi:hypothetical protein